MKILVIIPAHNEEDSILGLLNEVRRAGYDAVVINDASSDSTEATAKNCGYPVLSLPVNLGIGGGVQTGFIYALRNNYDIAVQVDGDGQHDPAQIAKIVAPILAGTADFTVGSRYVPSTPDSDYKTPFARRVGMHFSSAILYLATRMRIHDTTSGFRALNREALEYFAMEYPVDHPEAEALLMLHQAGFRVTEVPVTMRGRTAGQSLFTFFKAMLYPLRVIIGFLGLINKPSRRKHPKC